MSYETGYPQSSDNTIVEEVENGEGDIVGVIEKDSSGQMWLYFPAGDYREEVESYEAARQRLWESEAWYLDYVYEGEVIRLIDEGEEINSHGVLWFRYCELLDNGTLARIFPDKFK